MDRRSFFSRAAAAAAMGLFGSSSLVPKNKEEGYIWHPEEPIAPLRTMSENFILMPEREIWFGDRMRKYHAGLVQVPTVKGRWFVYTDDPQFKGGAVKYVATRNEKDLYIKNGRIYFGSIVG